MSGADTLKQGIPVTDYVETPRVESAQIVTYLDILKGRLVREEVRKRASLAV